jgi:hypothetical protein
MSSGNYLDDKTVTMSLSCGTAKTGAYFKKVWTGGSTPRGQKRKDLPYSLQLVSTREPVIGWKSGPGGFQYNGTISSCFGGPSRPAGVEWTSADDSRLLGKLVQQVRRHDFNAAVTLAEGYKTLDMIAKNAETLALAMRDLKKLNFSSAARRLKVKAKTNRKYSSTRAEDLSSQWLQLQYGWLPLLNDVKNGAEAFAASLNKPIRSSVRATHTRRFDGPVTTVGTNLVFDLHYKRQKQIIYRFEEDYSMIPSMGLLDPESVAWELLPYSFVADWFLPIGNWLETRAHIRRLKGTFVQSDLDYSRWEYRRSAGSYIITNADSCYARSVSFNRTVSTSPPSVPFPSFKPLSRSLSWRHCTSALALVATAFKAPLRDIRQTTFNPVYTE